ncbi:MAG: alpha-N-arabinofuranosidase [Acidobacteria bacterium]|nr:alpha-N-arabinofuranosidase [Acidobacteriota bacterium]
MNRRRFLLSSMAAGAVAAAAPDGRVAVLLVDTDRVSTPIDERIYGQFLEHINHSVEDGLFAEQIRGAGFEGTDFKTYWTPFAEGGAVEIADVEFSNGEKSVRLRADGGRAGIRQGRIFVESGRSYDGWAWLRRERGAPELTLRVVGAKGETIATAPLAVPGAGWQEARFSFTSPVHDTDASVEIGTSGSGAALVDFVSLMRADVRRNGMLRPDLLQSLRNLAPSFIRWPGGSFASTYKWKEGIGPYVSRGYHPNLFWGGYSDYFGFGTDEFLGLCRKLNSDPLIVLAAPGTESEQVEYAMDWVRYLNDPPATDWGRRRAANGHPELYNVRLFQIDNEPMNNGFTAERYADVVNVYGARLRHIAPEARIVACGQKRSNDMEWSKKLIDLAGKNFDILGVHNYEYEPGGYESGLRRIRNYLVKLRDYIRVSARPQIRVGVLEWNLSRTYDWRAGLHAAGSLMLYEELGPELTMTCPALLMRNTTDNPTWTSLIYHDHVSWFPGGAYPVAKLFREHYAERCLATASGTVRDVADRKMFFQEIATMKPDEWQQGTVDAIATASADGRRIVIKAVNYEGRRNTLLLRLQGVRAPEKATARLHTITARLTEKASLERPDVIQPVSRTIGYLKDLAVELEPYTVAVLEIRAV